MIIGYSTLGMIVLVVVIMAPFAGLLIRSIGRRR